MGKTYKKNDKYRQKKGGHVFIKDKPWKKSKPQDVRPDSPEEG